MAKPAPSTARDFDFLFGTWTIKNERLKSRLTNCTDWEQFTAHGACHPVLGGSGNVDSFEPKDWSGHEDYLGGALRLVHPATGVWSIYWFDNVAGALWPPVHGAFRDGVGEFYGDDHHGGVPVRVRYRWSDITATSARWEQSFSPDNGVTWERNWVMGFIRRDC